jgi:hypothetical protein
VLESLAWEILAELQLEALTVSILGAENLQGVSCKGRGTIETAVKHPRMSAPLRQILSAHDDRPAVNVALDMMVDVLGSIGLVVHQKAAVT